VKSSRFSDNSDGAELAPPEMPRAFDAEGRPIAVTHPAVYDDCEPEADDDRSDFPQKLALFLEWLSADGSPKTAGRKVILISYIAGRTKWQTDAEAAAGLNISKGRISQLRSEIDAILPGFGRCNMRQIKP